MRVGGRLRKARMAYETTHPIILSMHSHVTQMLILYMHLTSLHAGPATLLTILNPSYHIEGLKQTMRKISKSCVVCQKAYARTSKQRMGELPEARTQLARPFSIVGVDFAAQGREHSEASQEEMLCSCFYLFCYKSGASRNSHGTYFKSLSRHSRSIYCAKGYPS